MKKSSVYQTVIFSSYLAIQKDDKSPINENIEDLSLNFALIWEEKLEKSHKSETFVFFTAFHIETFP